MTHVAASDETERGRLLISSTVLRKIAEHAADRSPGTAPRGARRTAARIRTDGQEVEVELDVALVYPHPVRETATRLRAAITEEVARLTGRTVRSVVVTVVGLLPEHHARVQ